MNLKLNQKKYSLLIYGCGAIGSRHLQAALKSKLNINIFIYDKDIFAKKNTITRINEISYDKKKIGIKFILNFYIYKKFDLVILATPAFNRFFLINKISSEIKFKNIVIEKIAFQSSEEFKNTINFFNKEKINSWVNCPRRLNPIYAKIKKFLNKKEVMKMVIRGGKWNFTSNLIHFIDLFCFFTNNNSLSVQYKKFGKIYKSKRENYYNFDGKIVILNNKDDVLDVESKNNNNESVTINIKSKTVSIVINENKKEIIFRSNQNNKIVDKNMMVNNHVSDLSTYFIDSILTKGKSRLVKANISYKHHKIMLNIFLNHFNRRKDVLIETCPIT